MIHYETLCKVNYVLNASREHAACDAEMYICVPLNDKDPVKLYAMAAGIAQRILKDQKQKDVDIKHIARVGVVCRVTD